MKYTTYKTKQLEELIHDKGWSYLRIGVYGVTEEGKEVLVGEYTRNYPVNYDTFFPFTLNGKDFALYSPEYTCTRIMSLPDCKDLGGEEPHSFGFCPVDYYVPNKIKLRTEHKDGTDSVMVLPEINEDEEEFKYKGTTRTFENGDITFYSAITHFPWGFVSGCIWGDDSSWKVEFLDLSEADKGIIKRDGRLGYLELPYKSGRLKNCINLDLDIEDDDFIENSGGRKLVNIAVNKCININSGFDFYDELKYKHLKKEFDRLVKAWKDEVNSRQKLENYKYPDSLIYLIGLGKDILPFIILELESQGEEELYYSWFEILEKIVPCFVLVECNDVNDIKKQWFEYFKKNERWAFDKKYSSLVS